MSADPVKITELPQSNTVSSDMVIPVVVDPAGIPTTKQLEVGTLFSNVESIFIKSGNTPVSSSDVVTNGRWWTDGNYIYIAVANNSIKRVALSAF